jgi:hypothetical protein
MESAEAGIFIVGLEKACRMSDGLIFLSYYDRGEKNEKDYHFNTNNIYYSWK